MKKIVVIGNCDNSLLLVRMEVLEALVKQGNEVYVSVPRTDKVKEFETIGCKYIETKTKIKRRKVTPIRDLILMQEYRHILKEVKPDLVLTYTIKPNIYGGLAARREKVDYIANITGLGILEGKGWIQKIGVLLYKIALKKANCVFCQNRENEQVLQKYHIGDGVLRRIPGSGVNLQKFSYLPYPTDKNEIRFLFVGRILKQKGIEEYLEMARQISKKHLSTKFYVLGDCEEKRYQHILRKAEKEGVLEYKGMQEDIRPFLKKSHCVIHPSYYPEGISNVLLEASACGRPIITTNRSGCREVVEEEKNGYIVKKKNVEDLVKKVEKFLLLPNKDREEMGKHGREKVEKEFNRDLVVQAYQEEIEKIGRKK